jgi:anti-sigma regulatory factor (Ser/Thr protein kinase)
VIGPRRPGSPVDDEGAEVVRWPDTTADHPGPPTRADRPPQPETPAAGSWPSASPTAHNGGPAGRCRDWRLPATESSVTVLRRGLNDFLHGADLSEDECYDLLLAVCEAASNAIEHARNPTEPFFDVFTEIGDARVTVVVQDHGQWSDDCPGVHRGRGLAMMWTLADSRVVPSPQGTKVTIHSSPRHRRHPLASHGRRGTAGESPLPSPAVIAP